MATQWGAWKASSGFAQSLRVGIDQVGTTLIAYAQTGSANGWSAPAYRTGSWSGSTQVSINTPNGQITTLELFQQTVSASGTYGVSLTSPIAGTATVSRSVSIGSAPAAPTDFRVSARNSGTNATLAFDYVSGATNQITASKNSAAWYDLATPTTGSQVVSMDSDAYYRFNIYARNAAGSSAVVGPIYFYTTPLTPGKPVLSTDAGGTKVTWTSTARYQSGVEVERSTGGVVTVDVSLAKSWVDTAPITAETKYRVRGYAGKDEGLSRAYSEWSAWSEPALNLVWRPPQLSFTAYRNDGGNWDELMTGTYIALKHSGVTTPVVIGGVEQNKVTRRYRHREVGGNWSPWSTFAANVAPGAWDNQQLRISSGGFAVTKAYEVQMSVTDTYTTGDGTVSTVTVSVATVALSLAKTGIGAGKVWQNGALDVGGDAHIEGMLVTRDANEIVIDGVPYQASGQIGNIPQTPAYTQFGAVYARTVIVPPPYTPPQGWYFDVSVGYTTGYTVAQTYSDQQPEGIPVRVIQVGSNSVPALSRLNWRLVKKI